MIKCSCPASRGIHTLHSSNPVPRCIAVRAEGGGLLTEDSKVKARRESYFEWLYLNDLSAVELDVRSVPLPISEPPINFEPPLFVETLATVDQLRGTKAPGISGIHVKLLKAGGNAVLTSLHAVLCSG